ncbi:MAG: hypothetical protein RJA57_9 [Bacteroidota bacterium]|jgi:hypothetical protein
MKTLLLLSVGILSLGPLSAQTLRDTPDSTKKLIRVEASCGECQFKMPGKGCHLAVRIDGKSYFVDGTSIDDHGDAHGEHGFCETVRKANVQGAVVDNRFKVTYFRIQPVEKKRSDTPPGQR